MVPYVRVRAGHPGASRSGEETSNMSSRVIRISLFTIVTLTTLALAACQGLPLVLVQPFKTEYTDKTFVNWETPHVSPLALSSDATTLLALNTPDARVEMFDLSGDTPRLIDSIPVGIDPVSVRFRTETEAWVANRISDSVSILDLNTRNVVRTLPSADEP